MGQMIALVRNLDLEAPEPPPPPRQLRLAPRQAFGKRLQEIREGPSFLGRRPSQPKMSRRELAEVTGIPEGTIEDFENGQGGKHLSVSDMRKWAEALSCRFVIMSLEPYTSVTTIYQIFANGGTPKFKPINSTVR